MSTYLIQSSLILSAPSRAILYDEAMILSEQGHKVYYSYCDGLMSQCFLNIKGNKALCRECRSLCRKEKHRFCKYFEFVSARDLVSDKQKAETQIISFNYNSIPEIKHLNYDGLNIGFGALSAYITISRNMNPLLDETFRTFFDENLRNSILHILALKEAVKRFSPDHIILYNGRFADSRPSWEYARQLHIPFTTLEAIYGLNRNFKARYINSTPFSLTKTKELADKLWEDPTVTMDHKIQTGSEFFKRRRRAQYTGDKIYTANQQDGLLPKDWNPTKHNIVIFNSSEDEFASIGGELEEKALFGSQIEGLNFIKNYFKNHPNVDITLRIHPNLSNVTYSYSTELPALADKGFRVIDSKSPISTYSLIDAADVVVVFGSTVGVEAPYWDKPAILLGGATYYDLDCCYTPANIEEMLHLMQTQNLPPKDRLGAVKFGYMLMTEQWERGEKLDFDWEYWSIKGPIFNGRKVQLNNWLKICNSRRLYTIIRALRERWWRAVYRFSPNEGNKLTIPTTEKI